MSADELLSGTSAYNLRYDSSPPTSPASSSPIEANEQISLREALEDPSVWQYSRQGTQEDMEERIENNERMIKASSEIDEEFTGDTLQREFKQLEKGSATVSVDNQLLALKQKMGMLPAPAAQPNKALGAGQRDVETVHAEIEHPTEEKGR